jgi:hypothetical protein
MGFEIDIPTESVDETEIEVLVHDSLATDILTREMNLADWKVATNTGRMLVGTAANVAPEEEGFTNKAYTVVLMNNSDDVGKRSVIYGGAAFLMASSTIFATAMLAL